MIGGSVFVVLFVLATSRESGWAVTVSGIILGALCVLATRLKKSRFLWILAFVSFLVSAGTFPFVRTSLPNLIALEALMIMMLYAAYIQIRRLSPKRNSSGAR